MRRALLDLRILRSRLDELDYFAAGIPWFATLFGHVGRRHPALADRRVTPAGVSVGRAAAHPVEPARPARGRSRGRLTVVWPSLSQRARDGRVGVEAHVREGTLTVQRVDAGGAAAA
jgi:hypothetical protein